MSVHAFNSLLLRAGLHEHANEFRVDTFLGPLKRRELVFLVAKVHVRLVHDVQLSGQPPRVRGVFPLAVASL